MASKDLNFNLRVATKEAQADLKSAAAEAKKLGLDLEDTGKTKAQALADGMKAAADAFDAEIDAMKAASEALGTAIGAELKADFDAAGVSVDQIVLDLKAAGLTFDEIRLDADALGDAVRRADQVDMSRLRGEAKQTAGQLGAVRDSGDQSRSVLANMVGNSAQDLGTLGGVAGGAGVALGQLAEYAADGNIKLKNMIGLGAGLAAVGGAMWAISKGAEQAAKRTREVSEAIDEVSRATDDQALAEYNKILGEGILSTDGLDESLKKFVETNIEGARRILDLGEDAGWTSDQIDALRGYIDDEERAIAQAKETTEKYGTATDDLGDSAVIGAGHLAELEQGAKDYKDAAAEAEQKTKDFDAAVKTMLGEVNAEQAWLDIKAKVDGFAADMAAAKGDTDAERLAVLSLKESMIEYVGTLETVPAEKKTEILALIDEENFRLVEAELAKLEKSRYPVYTPVFKPGSGGLPAYGATGGIVTRPTLAVIGEAGPEAVVPLNQTPGSSPLPSGVTTGASSDGARVANVTINVTSQDPQMVVTAIKQYLRRGGTL